jgi:uncharacterized RDD family membrane protein YckC
MAEKGILTGQYVRIRQAAASVGDRMLAQLIDWVLELAYAAFMIWVFSKLNAEPLTVFFVLVFPLLVYPLCCEVFNQGQSVGKMIMKTRVVMADGSVPSLSAYLLRWLLIIVDGPLMAYMGIVVIAATRHHQRIGDLAAGTMVVKLQSYTKIQVSLDEFDYVNENYKPHYPQAADLSLEQLNVISRALAASEAKGGEQRIEQLSLKVQQLLGVTPREQQAEAFLARIVRDYQYYALED